MNASDANSNTRQAEVLSTDVGQAVLLLRLRMAAQMAPHRWKLAVNRLIQQMEEGSELKSAFAICGEQMPGELRSIMQEAIHLPDPAAVLVQTLRTRDEVRRSWREFVSLIAYPLCIFTFALSVGIAFSFCLRQMIEFEFLESFGLAGGEQIANNLLDQHNAMVGLGFLTAWMFAVFAALIWAGPPWAWLSVAGGILVIGKPLRWIALQEYLCRLQMFIEQGMNSVDATAATSRSFASSGQSVAAAAIATRIKRGMPIGESLSQSLLADGLCRPALLQLDRQGDELSEAMTRTSELLGQMVGHRCRTLQLILPIFVLVMVGTILWSTLASYLHGLMPLLQMITSLA